MGSGYRCVVCEKEVPEYEPVMCCDGHECGCMALPVEPCVCSQECESQISGIVTHQMAERLTCWACEHKCRKEEGPTASSKHRCGIGRQGFPRIGSKCAAFLSETREGWRR